MCAGTTYACTDLTLPECHTVTGATCDENRTNGVEDTDNEGTTISTCTFPSDWTKKGTSCNDSDDCSYADKCGCVGGGTACAEASPGQGLECGGTDYSCLEGETGFVGNCTLDLLKIRIPVSSRLLANWALKYQAKYQGSMCSSSDIMESVGLSADRLIANIR